MGYTFRLIQCHEKIPHLLGWYWHINSFEMLMHLFEKTSTGFIAESVAEVMGKNSRAKVAAEKGETIPMGHFTNRTSYILEMILMKEFEKGERKNIDLLECSEIANDLFQGPKLKAFNEYGAIYVGPNLVGFTMDVGQRIVTEIKADEFVFPIIDEEITIGKWPGGKHYYLKSSGQREFDGKFDSYGDAHEHAKQFTSEGNIKSKDHFMYMRQGD